MGAMALAFFAVVCLMFDGELPVYLAYETVLLDTLFFLAACGLIVLLAMKRQACGANLPVPDAGSLPGAQWLLFHRSAGRGQSARCAGGSRLCAEERRLVARIQEQDGGLYRMERNQARTENDPLYFGYHGVSHYSSDFDRGISALPGSYGPVSHSLPHSVCQRHHAGTGGADGHQVHLRSDGASLEKLPDSYTQLWREGDTTAWQNPYALPLAVLAPLDEVDGVGVGEDPFENQNLLVEDLSVARCRFLRLLRTWSATLKRT